MEAHERARRFATLVALELAAEATRRGVTKAATARAAGITPQHFSHTLGGRKGAMAVDVLLRGAEHLGASPQEIVERAHARLIDELGAPPSTPAAATGTRPSESGPRVAPPHARAKRSSKGTRGSSSG